MMRELSGRAYVKGTMKGEREGDIGPLLSCEVEWSGVSCRAVRCRVGQCSAVQSRGLQCRAVPCSALPCGAVRGSERERIDD